MWNHGTPKITTETPHEHGVIAMTPRSRGAAEYSRAKLPPQPSNNLFRCPQLLGRRKIAGRAPICRLNRAAMARRFLTVCLWFGVLIRLVWCSPPSPSPVLLVAPTGGSPAAAPMTLGVVQTNEVPSPLDTPLSRHPSSVVVGTVPPSPLQSPGYVSRDGFVK